MTSFYVWMKERKKKKKKKKMMNEILLVTGDTVSQKKILRGLLAKA